MRLFLSLCILATLAATPAAGQRCDLPRAANAARHAESAARYTQHRPIVFHGQHWVPYGILRTVAAADVEFAGEYDGVPLYVECGAQTADIVDVLVNAGCEVVAYESHVGLRVFRTDPPAPPGTLPAGLLVSGCPRGANLFLFRAAEIARDPFWRSKLLPDEGEHFISIAQTQQVLIFSQRPEPYDVVLAWRGRTWRFRFEAVPGRTAVVTARPPNLRNCVVPMYPAL